GRPIFSRRCVCARRLCYRRRPRSCHPLLPEPITSQYSVSLLRCLGALQPQTRGGVVSEPSSRRFEYPFSLRPIQRILRAISGLSDGLFVRLLSTSGPEFGRGATPEN